MNTQKTQHEALIRGRVEIKVTTTKKITVTRFGEWGGKHSIIIEEIVRNTQVKTQRFDYPESQKCIKAFEQKIRDIKREYKNVYSC